jgi:hypothetical protein
VLCAHSQFVGSWSKAASVLYVDSPIGVGMSYSSNIEDYNTNDTKSARLNSTRPNLLSCSAAELIPDMMANGRTSIDLHHFLLHFLKSE